MAFNEWFFDTITRLYKLKIISHVNYVEMGKSRFGVLPCENIFDLSFDETRLAIENFRAPSSDCFVC